MRFSLTLLLTAVLGTCGLAQQTTLQLTTNDWTAKSPTAIRDGERKLDVRDARIYQIDPAVLRAAVFTAPHEDDVTAEQSPIILELPLPTGPAKFRVVSYDIAAPGENNYPDIRAGYGVNPDNPYQTIFLDWTEFGFHASIRGGGEETVFIDPLFGDGQDLYQVYRKSDFDPKAILPSTCEVAGTKSLVHPGKEPVEGKLLGSCELRQYRTAITATGEYSNYHGATSAAQANLVQSAVVTTINRVNQVFTRDISLRLQLIANNDRLYNYDPDNDPFPDNSVGSLISANTPYIDGRIGNAAYDYGHIFTRGVNNGVASLRASCINSRKAAGATSRQDPIADPFDIDYVAHEMGHNFGGNHTQNNNCNYSSSAGMEPGSASSIMGYAGICSPNVQSNSDDYFHGRSIEEMTTHIELNSGSSCGTIINSSLNSPTVTRRPADKTIPAGTPFVLRSGANAGGNLTYNWEQYDSERGEAMPPEEDNTRGPLFRSFEAKTSPERYFPRLAATLGGTDPMWEELPMVSREMNFRATVINQNAAYGCASEDDVRLLVDASGRPFTVSDPVAATQWSAGQIAQVQWDVAGTDAAPFNSQLVDVLVSTDGGTTFQTALTDAPNSGLAEITVPNEVTDNVRVMVRSKDNVFFNVSTRSSRIVTDAGAPTVSSELTGQRLVTDCFAPGSTTSFGLRTDSEGGATAPITWSVTGLPAGATAAFSVNPTRPGASLNVDISGLDNAPAGQSSFTIVGNSTDGTVSEAITIDKIPAGGGAGPATLGPEGIQADVRPTLAAEAASGEVTYHFQISEQADFATLAYDLPGQPAPTLQLTEYLTGETTYYWRVRTQSLGGCGASEWSASTFRTGNCAVYMSTQAPVGINPDLSFQEVDMTVSVPTMGEVLDVDVFNLDVTHTYISDLRIRLIGPDGQQFSTLADQPCGNDDDLLASFDDESPAALPCPATEGGFYQVDSRPLSNFDGLEASGDWTLRVQDVFNGDGGSLNSVSLKICQAVSLPVDLLSFTAHAQKDHIELIWATENEVDNLGFYVERQVAGAVDWQDLGFVAAGAAYTFADRTALVGTDYLYRLRQTDLDGRVSYSPIEAARLNGVLGEGAGAMIVYPNPTAGLVNYRFEGTPKTKRYTLTSLTGKRLAGGRLLSGSGSVDLRALPAGVYLLRVGNLVERVVRL